MPRVRAVPTMCSSPSDDPGDALLISEGSLARGFSQTLRTISDGVETFEYLREPTHPRPDLIIMDLNTPRMDGPRSPRRYQTDPVSRRDSGRCAGDAGNAPGGGLAVPSRFHATAHPADEIQ
ncbi:hypothetical protein FMEAI12_2580002 [Parafrankia sp. Ea1.12]|nr:hypothetical protein FMEAI12_2580002 [Parafrankia sp. Ea1.12]